MQEITDALLRWYDKNARALPWRESKNPYYIWLSEIMLQQTRVEAVKPYFERFIATLPTIAHLAQAEEETLLKLWEGLGYYSRVKNMQKAAQTLVEQYNGRLPADYHALLGLKGIGPYTAGAIASIAFSLPYAAVDGNVLRVMSRLTADVRDITLQATKKIWETELAAHMPQDRAGAFNQALMELGAMICIPNGQPKCAVCPVQRFCRAYCENAVTQYPVKAQKKERRKEYLSVFFIVHEGRVALRKRSAKGLLSGMWELPSCDVMTAPPAALRQWGIENADLEEMKGAKHIFTHIEWYMSCYFVQVWAKEEMEELVWRSPAEIAQQLALPSAFKKPWQEGCLHMQAKKGLFAAEMFSGESAASQ